MTTRIGLLMVAGILAAMGTVRAEESKIGAGTAMPPEMLRGIKSRQFTGQVSAVDGAASTVTVKSKKGRAEGSAFQATGFCR